MNIFTTIKIRPWSKSQKHISQKKKKNICVQSILLFLKKTSDWKNDLKRSSNDALFNSSLDDNSTSADIVDQASSYTEKNVELEQLIDKLN